MNFDLFDTLPQDSSHQSMFYTSSKQLHSHPSTHKSVSPLQFVRKTPPRWTPNKYRIFPKCFFLRTVFSLNCEQIRDLRLMSTFATEDVTTNSPTVAPSDGNQKVPVASTKKQIFCFWYDKPPIITRKVSLSSSPFRQFLRKARPFQRGNHWGPWAPLRFLRNSHSTSIPRPVPRDSLGLWHCNWPHPCRSSQGTWGIFSGVQPEQPTKTLPTFHEIYGCNRDPFYSGSLESLI